MRIQCPCCLKSYRLPDTGALGDFHCERCGNIVSVSTSAEKAQVTRVASKFRYIWLWIAIPVVAAVPVCVLMGIRMWMSSDSSSSPDDDRQAAVKTAVKEVQQPSQLSVSPDQSQPVSLPPSADSSTGTSMSDDMNVRRQQLVQRLEKSVVLLKVRCADQGKLGSGFLADLGGSVVLITNFHVVNGAQHITAEFQDGKLGNIRGYRWASPSMDLCVLDVQLPPGERPPLPLLDDEPAKGAEVLALGAPEGLGFSVTNGIVSALRTRRETRWGSETSDDNPDAAVIGASLDARWIQTSAPIWHGNSGGPLVDLNGVVVGVNTFFVQATDAGTINFALSTASILRNVRNLDGVVHPIDALPQALQSAK